MTTLLYQAEQRFLFIQADVQQCLVRATEASSIGSVTQDPKPTQLGMIVSSRILRQITVTCELL